MTCHETRELFSALVDDALEDRERSAVDAHLTGCVDCRRELDRFRRTVALVQALPGERAPAGFVDRVVASAQPASWPTRLLRGLFVPWTMKLPLEAVAIVLVGGLAVWVFQRTPEQQQAVQFEPGPPRAEAPAEVQGVAPRESAPMATEPAPTAPTPTAPTPAVPTPAPATAPAEKARGEQKETQDVQSYVDVRARRSEVQPQRAVPEPREEPARESQVTRNTSETRAAQSPPAATSAARVPSALRPPDVSGRLVMDDPAGGATTLVNLVRRFGGSMATSRADGDTLLVELSVPGDRYPDFAREVARLGRWQAEADATATALALPETVRVRIRLTR